MNFGPGQIGKLLIVTGITIALLGAIVMLLGRAGPDCSVCRVTLSSEVKTGGFICQFQAAS